MKFKNWILILLVLFSTIQICVKTSAAESSISGIYSVTDETVIHSIQTSSGQQITPVTEQNIGKFYPDAELFSVTCPNVVAGKEYAIFIVYGTGKPSQKNTVYVDQKTANENNVTFSNISPKELADGQYHIYVTGGGRSLNTEDPLATFAYREAAPYTLTVCANSEKDDCAVKLCLWKNGKKIVENTSTDASAIFQCAHLAAGSYTLTIEKSGYVAYSESVTLSDNKVLEITLYKQGDIDGNRSALNKNYGVLDMQCLYTFLSENRNEGQIANEIYFKRIADVNDDGFVNILDYQCLYDLICNHTEQPIDYSKYGTDALELSSLTSDNIFLIEATPSSDGTRIDLSITLTGAVKLCGFDMTLHYDNNIFALTALDTEKDLPITFDRQDNKGVVSFNYANAKNITKSKTILTANFIVKDPVDNSSVFWLSPEEVAMIGDNSLDPVAAPYLCTYRIVGNVN